MGDKGNQSDEQNDNNNIKTQKRLPFKQRMTNALTELSGSIPGRFIHCRDLDEWISGACHGTIAAIQYNAIHGKNDLMPGIVADGIPEFPEGTTSDGATKLLQGIIYDMRAIANSVSSKVFKQFLDEFGLRPELFLLSCVTGEYVPIGNHDTIGKLKFDTGDFSTQTMTTKHQSTQTDALNSGPAHMRLSTPASINDSASLATTNLDPAAENEANSTNTGEQHNNPDTPRPTMDENQPASHKKSFDDALKKFQDLVQTHGTVPSPPGRLGTSATKVGNPDATPPTKPPANGSVTR